MSQRANLTLHVPEEVKERMLRAIELQKQATGRKPSMNSFLARAIEERCARVELVTGRWR